MIIIGFCTHTSKILPRILCRRFRHCAVIVPNKYGKLTMYQFVRRGHVAHITLRGRDLAILRAHGWRFIFIPMDLSCTFNATHAQTCVDLAKRAIGMRTWRIQTPNALYKQIRPFGADLFY